MAARKLRIFISSPGDVGQERLIAARLVERLQGEFTGHAELEPILWEHEPLRASAHFQEQILPPSQTDIVICILWSRLGTRLPEQFHREDGSLYSSGTEWEFEDALRSFRERGTPDLMVYRKTAEPQASMSNEELLLQRLQQKKALDAFIDRWFGNPTDSFRFAFHTFDSPDKFETLLETHLRKLIRERLPQHLSEPGGEAIPIQWLKGSPFRGLEAFDIAHAPVFFGRTRAIAEIKDALLLQAQKGCAFVLVFGMSGCGKSSLVKAGALPTIIQPGVIDGIGLWRWCLLRPSDSPDDLLLSLSYALLKQALPEMEEVGFDGHELATLLRQAPESAMTAIRNALERAAEITKRQEQLTESPKARLAVVVDQLEEIFTLAQVDDRERRSFVVALSALAGSGCVWVIATMRSDFFPRCVEIPELVALKEGAGQFDTLPPSFAEIGQMIRYPARAAGLTFEVNPKTNERLDERIHEAAARDPAALPLLEFTLDELFEQRTETGVLTFEAYERLGGLEGALARRAEEVFQSLEPGVQKALPAVLRGLIAVEEPETVAAKRAPISAVAQTPEQQTLVDAFIKARLLVTDQNDEGKAVVRVAHEALLRHWPRIREWLAEDLEFLQQRERISEMEHRWIEEGRGADFLLTRGKPLTDALDLLSHRREDLDSGLVEYIEASRKAVNQTRRRRIAVISGVVLAFFIVVAGFGGFSYAQWQQAEQKKALALKAVNHLTYDIPKRLIDLPGSRPALRTIFAENVGLLDQVASDAKAKEEKRANYRYMGDMWLLLGDTVNARDSYRKSLAIAEDLAKDAANENAQWELAVSQGKIGDVSLEENDPKAALPTYQKSLTLLERLAKSDKNPRLRRDLSAAYEKIGDTKLALSDLPGALEAYQKDLAIAQELAKDAKNDQAQRDLSVSYTKIGDVQLAGGDANAALESYGKSMEILLDREKKGDPAAQRTLSATCSKIGDAFLALNDKVRAGKAYQKSQGIAAKLARDRTNARAQRDLWVSDSKLAELHAAQGNLQGALSAYQSALSVAQDLALDKSNVGAQEDLKYTYEKLRDLYSRLGKDVQAQSAYVKSLEVSLDLLNGKKTDAAQRERAELFRQIGQAKMDGNDLTGAEAAYQQSLELYRTLAETSSDAALQRNLAAAYDAVAYVMLLEKRPQEAMAIATEGAALDPRQARIQATLAHAYLFSGQFDKAMQIYLQSRSLKLDDRLTFTDIVQSDFKEFRARGLSNPNMPKVERLLSAMPR
jgi:energy-coupling factor transporter ATP-binding protein EcfA2